MGECPTIVINEFGSATRVYPNLMVVLYKSVYYRLLNRYLLTNQESLAPQQAGDSGIRFWKKQN